ncbi:MAG: PAS domain-containing protein [Gemmatimonadales bacterium]|nr:MAG: PAS domain-containing protein [Gemmatimonadales bacterium]
MADRRGADLPEHPHGDMARSGPEPGSMGHADPVGEAGRGEGGSESPLALSRVPRAASGDGESPSESRRPQRVREPSELAAGSVPPPPRREQCPDLGAGRDAVHAHGRTPGVGDGRGAGVGGRPTPADPGSGGGADVPEDPTQLKVLPPPRRGLRGRVLRGDEVPGSVGMGLRFSTPILLRWLILVRLLVAAVLLALAAAGWRGIAGPERWALLLLVAAAAGMALWGRGRIRDDMGPPGRAFLLTQLGFDVLLVTGLVHLTGSTASLFAALYVPLLALGAILLPATGTLLLGAWTVVVYVGNGFWAHGLDPWTGPLWLQLGLFALVAFITLLLADRVRRAGVALGVVESELRRLQIDTGDILATVSSGVLTIDLRERLVYLNAAGEELLQVDAASWFGRPILDRVEEDSPQLASFLRSSLRSRSPVNREVAEVFQDGRKMALGVTTTLREADDGPRSVTAIFQDITDSQRLANLDRQTQRLEAVTELSASMAHEIKNPLASIRSAVEQFTSPHITDLDREVLSRMVIRESDRLSRLLSDFIDFSRVQISRPDALDLNQVVRDALAVVRRHPEIGSRRVEVVVDVPAEPVEIEADADILHRSILNLLLNAVQFSPAGGKVEVYLEGRKPGSTELGIREPVSLRVLDQGPGVPPEDAARIFDPFFTTREGGSGLGLAIVHRAAEAHGGAILVEPRAEGGTEFILILPARWIGAPPGRGDRQGDGAGVGSMAEAAARLADGSTTGDGSTPGDRTGDHEREMEHVG